MVNRIDLILDYLILRARKELKYQQERRWKNKEIIEELNKDIAFLERIQELGRNHS